MGIEELIAALEKAEGPSRELDAAVFARLCRPADFTDFNIAAECRAEFEPDVDGSVRMYVYGPREEGPNYVGRRAAPVYTSSVDAALTLVPANLGCQVGRPIQTHGPFGWYGSVFDERPTGEAGVEHSRIWHHDRSWNYTSSRDLVWMKRKYAANPALALCIAALRARSGQ